MSEIVNWEPEKYIKALGSVEEVRIVSGLNMRAMQQQIKRKKINDVVLGYLDACLVRRFPKMFSVEKREYKMVKNREKRSDDFAQFKAILANIEHSRSIDDLRFKSRVSRQSIRRILMSKFNTKDLNTVRSILGYSSINMQRRRNTTDEEVETLVDPLIFKYKSVSDIAVEANLRHERVSRFLFKKYGVSTIIGVRAKIKRLEKKGKTIQLSDDRIEKLIKKLISESNKSSCRNENGEINNDKKILEVVSYLKNGITPESYEDNLLLCEIVKDVSAVFKKYGIN